MVFVPTADALSHQHLSFRVFVKFVDVFTTACSQDVDQQDCLWEGDVESQISEMIWKGYAIDTRPYSAHLNVTQVHHYAW